MTIKSSGALSMAEVNAEFGLGYNLNAYRGVTWYTNDDTSGTFDATNINISEFYSRKKVSPKITAQYNGNWSQDNDRSSYTTSAFNIGSPPDANHRRFVIIAGFRNVPASLSLDGFNFTPLYVVDNAAGFYYVERSTGTTGTVYATYGGTQNRGGWGCWTIYTDLAGFKLLDSDYVGEGTRVLNTSASGIVLAQLLTSETGGINNWTNLTHRWAYDAETSDRFAGADNFSVVTGTTTVGVNIINYSDGGGTTAFVSLAPNY